MGGDVPKSELVHINTGDSITSAVKFYKTQLDFGHKKPVYLVDTPGFGDTRTLDTKPFGNSRDSSAVHSEDHTNVSHANKLILAFQNKQITKFSGVFWFVGTCKAEEGLREEAAFINKLAKPEDNGHGFCIWDHVVVILRGDYGVEGAQTAVSHVIGGNNHKKLHGVQVFISRKAAGLTGFGDGVVVIEQDERLAVRGNPTHAGALLSSGSFEATASIKWINQTMKCQRCLQSGDPRAFYACHREVEAIHCPIDEHPGYLLQIHGEREWKDLAKSVGKKTAAVVGVAAGVTTVALTVVASLAIPNPVTPALGLCVAHLTIGIGATGAVVPIAQALGKGAFPGNKSRMPLVHLNPAKIIEEISKEMPEETSEVLSKEQLRKLSSKRITLKGSWGDVVLEVVQDVATIQDQRAPSLVRSASGRTKKTTR
ncbi:hypothetical protein A1O1_08867 [Capronia coronata CBS 617.96]|uniref:Uncharacterized protein n=1 Tax=Capronia coronata CBS 617.96 TaxID=1182541 RepID=W9XDC4_9EURO|nr:uncharacterized protein A1O1_08867 [Capronia coronata CBS 617.96]EXJ78467.1 hypothetical protein A1O1_08867 [Capronia coronata CBS 617.96]